MFMTKNKPLLSGNHQIVGPHMNQNRHKTMPLPRKCLHLEHQESGSIMVNQTFYKAFPLSEEKMPVQCSSDYLQAFLNFAWFFFFLTQDFVQTYFVHLICYHVQLWHGRSWFFSPLSKAELSIWRNHSVAYTPTDVCLLCSKVDLMEEDHSLLALVPMQNLVRGAEFLSPCKFRKWHISSWGSQFQYVSVLVVLTFLEYIGPGWFGPCLKHLLGSCQTYILLFRME